jgi:hypothetical protein
MPADSSSTHAAGHAAPAEKPPVDPGCLPAWSVDDMPAPVPIGWKTLLALVGPGLVLAGSSLGTGEWIVGASIAARYHGLLLWVAPLAILCQVMLNTEAMRYTLLTGEPVFTGFLRSKPGPRFWLIFYIVLDCLSWWPTLAGLSAQILLFWFSGMNAQVVTSENVRMASCAILIGAAILLCFGGKIYNTLEVVLGGKVLFVLGYMIFVTLTFVPFSTWMEVIGNILSPWKWPHNPDLSVVGAAVGFAGIGGMGNILASNYVREKGWGMGAKVGAIASAVGGQGITLSHLGTMARPGAENKSRFARWWTQISVDQYGLWAGGSMVGMLLPCLLGAQFLNTEYLKGADQWRAAVLLATDFGGQVGPIFTHLTLLCGLVILLPGAVSSMDGIARRWCDAVWSGSRRARQASPDKVRYLYYGFIGAYVTAGCALNMLGVSPPKMMLINGNLANLAITCCMFHTLYVNMRFLPVEYRPPLIKRVGMIAAAGFYMIVFGFMTAQVWPKLVSGEVFR